MTRASRGDRWTAARVACYRRAVACPDDTAFAAYLDGTLATAAVATFDRHLDECPACRELFAAMGRVVRPEDPTARVPRLRPRGSACGRYWVLDVRGAGGMGVVYTAYDPELDRKVALKLVRPQPTRRGVDLRERLVREARALARISHPNVVPVYDVGEADGEVFIAMELVPGPTLARWQAAQARPWRTTLEMYLQAARGLARAHEAGVVHRDFKPSNAIVGPDGRVRVVDFGLALAAAAAAEAPAVGAPGSASSSLTATGALVGTPAYMAPEQWHGAAVDARSDQYSFCAALWEALTGARHDAHSSDVSSRDPSDRRHEAPPGSSQLQRAEPPRAVLPVRDAASPALRRSPRWLRQLLQRGLAEDPQARFPGMPALIDACERRLRRGRLGAALAGAGVAAALVAVIAGRLGPQLCDEDPTLLAGVWDDETAAALQDAFVASGQPFATTIAATAIAELDAYAERWRTEHRVACEATRLYGHQTEAALAQRTACLDDRREALRARLALLRGGDRDVVEAALAIVHDLPEPATCRDPAALASYAEADGDDVRAARAAVDHAATLVDAGRFTAAETAVADAAETARIRGWHALTAAAQRVRGEARRRGGDAAAAEDPYYAALWAAEAARDDRAAARVWLELTWLLADDLSRPAEATRAVAHARAALARVGDDPLLAAEVEVCAAIAERASGDFKTASETLERAVASLESHTSAADPRLLAALRLYGRSLFDLGEFTAAIAVYRRALALAEQSLGADHPAVADLANNLGTALIDLGQPDAAEPELRRALAIADRVYGPLHLSTTAPRTNLANLAHARHDLDGAEQQYREILQIYARQPMPHPDAAKVAYNYGFLLINRDRFAEALAQFEAALDLQRRTLGEDHPDAGAYLTGIGVSLAGLGRHDEAVAPLERAVATFERRERDARFLASARSELGKALWTSGRDRPRAVALARQALAAFRASPESERLAREVEVWLAEHPLPH